MMLCILTEKIIINDHKWNKLREGATNIITKLNVTNLSKLWTRIISTNQIILMKYGPFSKQIFYIALICMPLSRNSGSLQINQYGLVERYLN